MHLIVGLGNPGKRYERTSHNAGFLVCDRFAERNHLGEEVAKYDGLFRRGRLGSADVGILKPQTYMNLSGRSVAQALRYLPVEPADMVVVFDDMDIPAGRLRLRKAGGTSGHNGMRSIVQELGTRDFPRIRLGIGRPQQRSATAHVLSKPSEEDAKCFEETVELAAEALEIVVKEGFEAAMNRYNAPLAAGTEGEEVQ